MAKNIVKRLTEQLRARGESPRAASAIAFSQMRKAGNVGANGKLTAKGERRSEMGAAGRAKDRAAKRLGGSPKDFTYNPRTNYARKRV